jgi:hypothetical protein
MTQSEPRVARPLAELVPLIRADIAAGEIAKASRHNKLTYLCFREGRRV